MRALLNFFKHETVFCISFILAIVSFLFVPVGFGFVKGIDFKVLSLLFCLMSVVGGLQKLLVFRRAGNYLIHRLKGTRSLYILLVYMCFFTSMLLTNDVALITFVPFAVMILPLIGREDRLITIVILQTIAANLGSMLTPLGNPQNLYLYSISGMSFLRFAGMMLPLWALSLVLVTIPILFMKNLPLENDSSRELPARKKNREYIFWGLFVLALLTVVHVLPYTVVLPVTILVIFFTDRSVFRNVDYFLLLTFVFFFIFIYNIKMIPSVNDWLANMIVGRTFYVGLLTSQVISNVPAALLLSGFTEDIKALVMAVDIGGLGTIIASLASLISFKLYAAGKNSKCGKYFLQFTLWNIIYLIILVAAYRYIM